jgi:nitrogen fixation protein NifT
LDANSNNADTVRQWSKTMKVMIRKNHDGVMSAYIAKKDLEEPIVAAENQDLWGGVVTLANGWKLELPLMASDTTLPITVEARRIATEEGAA